jgi:hypothetical protein
MFTERELADLDALAESPRSKLMRKFSRALRELACHSGKTWLEMRGPGDGSHFELTQERENQIRLIARA